MLTHVLMCNTDVKISRLQSATNTEVSVLLCYNPTRTCAYKHHVVLLAICILHLVNYNACECRTLSHQQRFLSNWLDGLVHEGLIFDKLKGPVREVQRLSYTRFTSLIVYTLSMEEGKKKREHKSQSTKRIGFVQGHSFKKETKMPFEVLLYFVHTHAQSA